MDSVVKIDAALLKQIEEFVKENKYKYSSNKQVVNLAIIEFLKSFSWKEKQNRKYKNEQSAFRLLNKSNKNKGGKK